MGLSIHEDVSSSVMQELERLDETPVLLNNQLIKPSQCFRLSGNPPKVLYNTNCPDHLKEKIESILLKYRNRNPSASYFYTVEFSFESIHYTGRLTPEFKKNSAVPSSWHIVLNEVFFGYLHKDNNHWEISEQRPAGLVEKLGSLIDSKAYQPNES